MVLHDSHVFPNPDKTVLSSARLDSGTGASNYIIAAGPKLHRLAGHFRVGPWLGDDLMQAGRIALWKSLRMYDCTVGAFDAYATRAVRNAMHDVVEESRRLGVSVAFSEYEHDLDAPIAAPAHDIGASRRLRRIVRGLTGRQFDVIFLIYGCGMTERTAASVLGVSQPRVNRIRHDALSEIRTGWGVASN